MPVAVVEEGTNVLDVRRCWISESTNKNLDYIINILYQILSSLSSSLFA